MRVKHIGYAAALSLAILSQTGFSAQETMVFKNNYGSTLEITVNEDDSVQGFFTTTVATKDCQQVVGQKRPVVGFLTGNALTLSIYYPSCGSALSIIGNLKKDNKIIDSTWVATHQVDPTKDALSARFIGHNKYKRIS